MTPPAPGHKPRPVVFQTMPATRVWVAGCLAFGTAFLAWSMFFGLAETLLHVKHLVLQALLRPS